MGMHLTIFSFGMAVIWSSILIIVIYLFRKNYLTVKFFSISGLLLLYVCSLVRMVLPIELPFAKIVISKEIVVYIVRFLFFELWGKYRITIGSLLLTVWIGVSIFLLLRFICQYYNSIRAIECVTKKEDDLLQGVLKQLIADSRRNVKVAVFTSPAIKVPMSVGVINRYILLPDKKYDKQTAYYILLHEYTHQLNGDIIVNLLVSIMCCIYWWNPFVYLLKRDLEQTLEIKCDLAVTAAMKREERAAYLEVIVTAIKDIKGIRPDMKGGGLETVNSLYLFGKTSMNVKERFEIVSKQDGKSGRGKGNIAISILFIATLLISYSFVVQSHFEAPISEIEVQQGTYEINVLENYITKDMEDNYRMVLPDGETVSITEEVAQKMQAIGIKLVEED